MYAHHRSKMAKHETRVAQIMTIAYRLMSNKAHVLMYSIWFLWLLCTVLVTEKKRKIRYRLLLFLFPSVLSGVPSVNCNGIGSCGSCVNQSSWALDECYRWCRKDAQCHAYGFTLHFNPYIRPDLENPIQKCQIGSNFANLSTVIIRLRS